MDLLTPSELTGYRVIGVVGGVKYLLKKSANYALFADFNQAVSKIGPKLHTIIQTELYNDQTKNSQILTYSQQHHISYRFVPINSELFVGNLEVEIFKGMPVIDVHQTALVGWGRIVKRTIDLILSSVFLILAAPFMLIIVLAELISGDSSIFFTQTRLTRYDQKFTVYKFRTQYKDLDGTTPEEAFTKLGKPNLTTTYRNNGDYLENDPRITPLGKFLRQTSLDELPQLINVFKGDLSLIGPRALIPEELAMYTKRHAILSVRSGLTGLAQVSGRRDISFDERRRLDLYYVQNWSIWGDTIILLKTFWVIIRHKGAA
jgi:lipopolysaccharide/colanic/teichoic acid biosynthesis glycosyltransferase